MTDMVRDHIICPRCGDHTNPNTRSWASGAFHGKPGAVGKAAGLAGLLGVRAGSHMGIAALGGAINGALPLAVVGAAAGLALHFVLQHAAWCPKCRLPFTH
jgi:hypothetical protein